MNKKKTFKILYIAATCEGHVDANDWMDQMTHLHQVTHRHPKSKVLSIEEDEIYVVAVYEGRKSKGLISTVLEATGHPDYI